MFSLTTAREKDGGRGFIRISLVSVQMGQYPHPHHTTSISALPSNSPLRTHHEHMPQPLGPLTICALMKGKAQFNGQKGHSSGPSDMFRISNRKVKCFSEETNTSPKFGVWTLQEYPDQRCRQCILIFIKNFPLYLVFISKNNINYCFHTNGTVDPCKNSIIFTIQCNMMHVYNQIIPWLYTNGYTNPCI